MTKVKYSLYGAPVDLTVFVENKQGWLRQVMPFASADIIDGLTKFIKPYLKFIFPVPTKAFEDPTLNPHDNSEQFWTNVSKIEIQIFYKEQ